MTPEEVTREVRRIEITTRHLVRDIVAGEYSSAFRGRGVEFAEVREYQPGDDVRTIDWNVTARLGAAYVKRYLEERELSVLFVVDLSASGGFGSCRRTKGDLGDRGRRRAGAGGGAQQRPGRRDASSPTGSSTISRRPRVAGTPSGSSATCSPSHPGAPAPTWAARWPSWSPRSAAARSSSCSPTSWRRATRPCSAGSPGGTTWSGCSSSIRASVTLPAAGIVTLWDPESGAWRRIDTGGRRACGRTSRGGRRSSTAALERRLRERGADLLRLETGQSYAEPLLTFFRRRERMLWR